MGGNIALTNGSIQSTGAILEAQGGFPYLLQDLSRSVVIAHPCGGNCALPQAAVFASCAPATGQYRVQGAFARANDAYGAGVGVQGIVFRNDELAHPLFLAAIGSNNYVNPTSYFSGTGTASFDVNASLLGGDCLRIGVFAKPNAHDGSFDATAVRFQITPMQQTAPAPTFTAAGFTNGADFANGIAAGEIGTLFGSNLTKAQGINLTSGLPLPVQFLNTSVTLNGTAVPLLAVDNMGDQEQINFQAPFEITGPATVVVTNSGLSSQPVQVNVSAAQPGIFADGSGNAAAFHGVNNDAISPSSPAAKGETIVLYLTGLGPVSNQPADGSAAANNTLSHTTFIPTVTFGGISADQVAFSGLAPGFVGEYQIDVLVPANAPTGNIDLVVTVNGTASKARKVQVH